MSAPSDSPIRFVTTAKDDPPPRPPGARGAASWHEPHARAMYGVRLLLQPILAQPTYLVPGGVRLRSHALFVDQADRAGEEPRQTFAEAVAPVLPVVAVAGLDEAHLHAGVLEARDERAVVVDEALVDAARDEHAFGEAHGRGAEVVHEGDHGV